MPIVIWSTIFFYPFSSLMCCVLLCFWISIGHKLEAKVRTCIECLALIKACDCSLFNRILLIQDIWEGASHTFHWVDLDHLMLHSIVCKSALVHFCVHTWFFLGRLIKELVTPKDWKMFWELPITPNARKSFAHKTLPWPITGTNRGKRKPDRSPKIWKLEKKLFANFDNFY